MPVFGPPPDFPGDLTWAVSSLLAAWIVGPLYGINICVFIMCSRVLYLKGLKGANLMLLIVASVQFGLATGHVITLVVQLVRGFGDIGDPSNGPPLYLVNQATPEHVAQEVLYITNSLIGDAILIWRLWVIWDRNFWLCVPFIVLCIATGVAGYIALANLAHLTLTGTVFLARVHDWLLTTWSLSIVTQFGATLLIGYRFWRSVQWSSEGTRASRLSILWILIESGAIYSLTTVFLLGFSSTNTGALFAAGLGQISALAPTLIIVRAGLKSKSSSSSFTPAKGSINNPYNPPSRSDPRRRVESGSSQGDDGMVVHIKKATEIRLDELVRHDDYTPSSEDGSGLPKLPVYIRNHSES